VHRRRGNVNEAARIGVELKAERRSTTGRNSRSSNTAIGAEARRIVDGISTAVR